MDVVFEIAKFIWWWFVACFVVLAAWVAFTAPKRQQLWIHADECRTPQTGLMDDCTCTPWVVR